MWLGVEPNKTLAPMGFGLFCQLLTSPKLPLIIFNTTIYIYICIIAEAERKWIPTIKEVVQIGKNTSDRKSVV